WFKALQARQFTSAAVASAIARNLGKDLHVSPSKSRLRNCLPQIASRRESRTSLRSEGGPPDQKSHSRYRCQNPQLPQSNLLARGPPDVKVCPAGATNTKRTVTRGGQ